MCCETSPRVATKAGQPHKLVQPKRAVRGGTRQLETSSAIMKMENHKQGMRACAAQGSGHCIWFKTLHYH